MTERFLSFGHHPNFTHGCGRRFKDVDNFARQALPSHFAASGGQGFRLNMQNTAAVPAAVKPRERGEAVKRPDTNWKPYPCLLTRQELQAIIADQLG
ncbi:hypothetical protein DQ393_32275 [Rhizobium tropici]|uniref:Uncharacterized protein n=1 Tax=Rhizobium tropici TaxID=398 RepID=A0A329Y1B0_RHITR|nr:hypothetical protein DQ393_32275 [Rhizobium tropici]